jgi:hypothetical protein
MPEQIKKSSKKRDKSIRDVKLIVIPPEDEGLLGKYGYTLKDSHENRIKSLKKAFKNNSHLKILRHLNAIRTLQKSNEKNYNKLDKDMKWLQTYYKKFL